ncbi:MAG: NADH-quinone oxidoreductase subunit NuoF [Gammaproteobacteria bacterium]|nr:NADH-quinone oxidoreductase subunit NuoF [Gammaproteobacteria bacterium]
MERPLTRNIRVDREPLDLRGYERAGGYQALRRALCVLTPAEVLEEVQDSKLRGRGGAGFPTGMKWSFVPMGEDAPAQKYVVANADEMEPGTFKDRLLLEGDPHQLVEAMIIAAYTVQASEGYVFLRAEYVTAARRLSRAIEEARHKGLLGADILGSGFHFDLHLHTGAGRYICGEETALLSALEGRRPIPRHKPPYPQTVGLWGCPTVVNNVETLVNLPHIVNQGASWFRALSRCDDGGTKLYGASGKVRHPGVWELPMGTPLRELLEAHAGGMQAGHGFKALLPGGASTGFLVDRHLDLPMDYDSIESAGSRLGTGAIIVLDDRTCPVAMLRNLEHFFARESCGWCTPCREGLPWTEQLLAAIELGEGEPADLDTLVEHTRWLGMGKTFCAHAPGAMMPLQTGLVHFREDFERHIRERRCHYGRATPVSGEAR